MRSIAVWMVALAVEGCAMAPLHEPTASLSGALQFEEPLPPPRPVDDAGAGLEKKVLWDRVKIDEDLIAQLLSRREALAFPAKLAVVRLARDGSGYRPEALSSRELEGFQAAFRDDRRVSRVDTVSRFFLTRETDLQRLRYAAARTGCSMLFIYIQETTTARGWNSTANLNFLILPLFMVNGKTVKAETAMEGVLVGVGSNVAHVVVNSRSSKDRDLHNLASSEEALAILQEDVEREALR
ncbi:MAG TPA: hypothetical protein VEN81_11305, partial [Planctomycetota bacterium]|nr:hypothetical protein [Planctomycetota bacterium]